nr:hopanoid-associated sugar epimerase [Stakelama sediminis]
MTSLSDKVFLTGATGFVGGAVLRALMRRGTRPTVLVRDTSPRTNLSGFTGPVVTGDLRDRASLEKAMAGARQVFHVAADYRLWARDPEEIVRNNIATTRNVMEAALAAGVERIVYTSSVSTILPDPDGPADEDRAAQPDQVITAYKRSKVEAERLVERMVAEQSLPAVIVNPSTPVGPGDVRPTPTGRIIVEAANGRMPAYIESGLNVVHVDDVADGHIAALEQGQLGERYILGGDDVTMRDLFGAIARLAGRRPPRVRLPTGPLYPLAWVNEGIAQVTGKEPFLTRDALRMAKHAMFYSSTKAERDLGYRHRPYESAIADALTWFRAAGSVR